MLVVSSLVNRQQQQMEKASQAKLNPGPWLLLDCKAAADGRARTFGTQHAGGRGESHRNHGVERFEFMV